MRWAGRSGGRAAAEPARAGRAGGKAWSRGRGTVQQRGEQGASSGQGPGGVPLKPSNTESVCPQHPAELRAALTPRARQQVGFAGRAGWALRSSPPPRDKTSFRCFLQVFCLFSRGLQLTLPEEKRCRCRRESDFRPCQLRTLRS